MCHIIAKPCFLDYFGGQISDKIGTILGSSWIPQNPVGLGLCIGEELEKAVLNARSKIGKMGVTGAATAPDGILGNMMSKTQVIKEPSADN